MEDTRSETADLEAQLSCLTQTNAFLNKYFSLRKRCEQLQQSNEKLVNRVQHVKKMMKRYKRDKRYLISRLEEHEDGFRDAQVPLMWEEDDVFHCLRQQHQQPPPPPPYPGGSDNESTSSSSTRRQRGASGGSNSQSALSSLGPLLAAHGLADSTIAAVAASVGGGGVGVGPGNSSKGNRKVKVEKDHHRDPLAPKKPANAFLMFCQQRRPVIQEEHLKEHKEEMSHQEMTRRLAQQWNNLSQEEKKLYYELYDQEKERYEKEMREYSAKDVVVYSETDSIPVPARAGAIPSHSLQMKKERD